MIAVQQPVLRPGDVVRPRVDLEVLNGEGYWRPILRQFVWEVKRVHGDGRVTIGGYTDKTPRTTVLAKHLEVVR